MLFRSLLADHREHARLEREIAEGSALLKDPAGDTDLKELAAAVLCLDHPYETVLKRLREMLKAESKQ